MKLVGLISPNLSEDTLIDVYEVFPPDVRIEGRTLKVGKYTDDEFHRAELAFADLVRDLARQPLDFLMVTGELFLSFKGPGSDLEILDLVKQITAVPASTVLTAVVRGCCALDLKRVVMASPFPEDQDERLVKFLAHYGIEVVAFRGLGCPNADVIWELPPVSGYELASSLLREHPDVDGVYLPCNKWRTISVIERIEQDNQKPVVTNTQAWVWEALRLMNMDRSIAGYGRLLSEF
ncbi:MAG: maleate cis-trans isomerase family protein [Candidatus Binatia bacterium]